MAKRTPLNVAGPQVRRLRSQQNLSQEILAGRCEDLGILMSRSTLAKIEVGIRCVTDQELLVLARALKVKMGAFFPEHPEVF